MKKGMILGAAILLALMVLISGCGGGLAAKKEPTPGYRTGSQGLVINFVPNFPRLTMYDTESYFDVLIDVKNKGSYGVGYGGDSIYISGFDPTIITGVSTAGKQIPPLTGITMYDSEGGFDNIEFKGEIYPLKMKNIDRYPATILATACYGYQTSASKNVCVDPDPFSISSERKVCTAATVPFGSQGAPISVTAVEVEPTPSITRFKIKISNVGGGTVFMPGGDYLMKCSPYNSEGLLYSEIDKVRISSVEVAGRSITPTCKPVDNEGNARLVNGQGTVFCELGGLGSGPAYSTPMTVTLDYGYRTTATRQVTIIQSPS